MTQAFINTEPFPLQQLVAQPGGKVSGMNVAVAQLPASNFPRFIQRTILTTSLAASDLGTPAAWDNYQQDVLFRMTMGTVDGLLLDRTDFGAVNMNEYSQPLVIPVKTVVYLTWYDVLPASATKCVAMLVLGEFG